MTAASAADDEDRLAHSFLLRPELYRLPDLRGPAARPRAHRLRRRRLFSNP